MIILLQYASLCWLTISVTTTKIEKERQEINLDEDGGYTDLLVVIDKEVEENLDILTKHQVIDKSCQSSYKRSNIICLKLVHSFLIIN